MNLIYACVFHQESYIKLLKLLIQSINDKSNISQDTHILVLTSNKFLPLIKECLSKFDLKIDYYILNLHTLFEAGCARLHIFNYDKIDLYENILYLDTDILIHGDINNIFNLDISDDKLYAIEEGFIGSDLWGGPSFFSFPPYDWNLSAFSSGVLYFKNSISMKELFANINSNINTYIYLNNNRVPACLDQPFIVYGAISENKYDNQLLKPYSSLNPIDISDDIVIYHFAGGPGYFSTKYKRMVSFWSKVSNNVKICQYGTDGFGHQLEGTLRMLSISLNGKADYMYHLRKSYSFEHSNFNIEKLTNYLQSALTNMSGDTPHDNSQYNIVYNETRNFNEIIVNDSDYERNVYFYDGVGCGSSLTDYFENKYELAKSLGTLRSVFVDNNPHLPIPSYVTDTNVKNVCCHIRKGDAVGTRVLDNDRLIDAVRYYQKLPNVHITIHSDSDVGFLINDNTVIMSVETDVLQVLSDFIHADVLIMNYSGISISAHLLAKQSQTVICPNVAGVTFFDRILDKCIRVDDLLNIGTAKLDFENRKYSWQDYSITFLNYGRMDAFGIGRYVKVDEYTIRAFFGGRTHTITFDNEYKSFSSIREEDNEVVTGNWINH